jgi:transposase-like protein
MSASNLTLAAFNDEAEALAHIEAALWPSGPVCPHCGATDRIYALKGKTTRPGLRKCGHCKKQFTVMIGTIFERSHIALNKWLQALYLMCSSKKGISSHQLHRTLNLSYKAAWFMSHRIREVMRDGTLGPLGHFGGAGNAVEADETFIGRKKGVPVPKGGTSHKHAVLGLVERGGKVRTVHIDAVTSEEIGGLVRENVAREAWLMTDEAKHYTEVGKELAGHDTVNHSIGEYVSFEDATIHTNTIEGYFGLFKRGMKGVYQHCDEKHLHRYLAEFEFRYNNRIALGVDDTMRAKAALLGVVGRRLTYRTSDRAETGTTAQA